LNLILAMAHEILDDPVARKARDPADMLGLVLGLPNQVQAGWAAGEEADLPALPSPPVAVAVLGMGGSGIGGDLLRSVLAGECTVPVVVVKDYRVPRWFSQGTLAFAVSYSGNTEETLAAYQAARDRGASVVAITSGGRLAEMAQRDGVPVIRLPAGLPPRAAIGHLFFPMLALLHRLGVLSSWGEEVRECVEVLRSLGERLGPSAPVDRNPAKHLATRLHGGVPVVYATASLLEPAALRWKCQFNENSKTLALWNVFPELNHNETVGWGVEPELARSFQVVLLRDREEDPRITQRVAITVDLALHRAGGLHEVRSEGRGKLARLFSTILFGDLTSVYLAYLRGVDPTPVDVIEELKRRLGNG